MAVCVQMKRNNLKTPVCSCEVDLSDAKSQDVSDHIITASSSHLAKNLCVCVFKNPRATSEEMLKQITIDPTCQSVQVTVNNLGSRAQRQSVSSN